MPVKIHRSKGSLCVNRCSDEKQKTRRYFHTEESFFNFDSNGRLDFSDRNEMIELVFDSLPPIGEEQLKEKIVDARHHFAKKKYKRKFTWKPTPQIAETIVEMIFGKSK